MKNKGGRPDKNMASNMKIRESLIMSLVKRKKKNSDIAKIFNINRSQITRIVNRKRR